MSGEQHQGPVLAQFDFAACFESLQRAENAHKQSLVVANAAKAESKDATAIASKAYDSCKNLEASIHDATEVATNAEKVAVNTFISARAGHQYFSMGIKKS